MQNPLLFAVPGTGIPKINYPYLLFFFQITTATGQTTFGATASG